MRSYQPFKLNFAQRQYTPPGRKKAEPAAVAAPPIGCAVLADAKSGTGNEKDR
jgi:hypothetical protein